MLDKWCRNASFLRNNIATRVALIAFSIEDAGPIWPLQKEATGSVVDFLTPCMVWFGLRLGSSHASVDAFLATNEHGDVSELVLEREMINYKPIELETSVMISLVVIEEIGNVDLLQRKWDGLVHARCNPRLADAVAIEIFSISEAPMQAALAVAASAGVLV